MWCWRNPRTKIPIADPSLWKLSPADTLGRAQPRMQVRFTASVWMARRRSARTRRRAVNRKGRIARRVSLIRKGSVERWSLGRRSSARPGNLRCTLARSRWKEPGRQRRSNSQCGGGRYYAHRDADCRFFRVKSRLIPELLAALNAARDKVMFPAERLVRRGGFSCSESESLTRRFAGSSSRVGGTSFCASINLRKHVPPMARFHTVHFLLTHWPSRGRRRRIAPPHLLADYFRS